MLRVGRMLGVLRMLGTRFGSCLGPLLMLLLRLGFRTGFGPGLRSWLGALLPLRLRPGFGPLLFAIRDRRTDVSVRLRLRVSIGTSFRTGLRMGRPVFGLRRLGVGPGFRADIVIRPGVVFRPVVVAGPGIPRWNRPAEIRG